MKRLLSFALATGVLLATAGAANAQAYNYWRTYPSAYNYNYTPYTGYYPPQAYGNYGYYNNYNAYSGYNNPYYNAYPRNNTLRRIGTSLLRSLF